LQGLRGLADEHGSNAEAHDEEPAEAVQQVHTTFELCAVRINNGDGNYCHETIERVKRWEHCFIAVHHDDAENDLNENGELCNAGVPPQCARAQRNQFVCRQCPNACECVANNDNPSPVGVEIVQSLCVHRKNNLPHRGGGFIASVVQREVFVVVYMKRGDGTVVEVGNDQLVVIGDKANDRVDGNEVAEDNGVVLQVFYEVTDVVFVVHKLLAKFLPGAGHGLLQPWAALVECDVAGCRNFGHFGMNADWRVLCCGKRLRCFLAPQQWAADDGDVV
jgi:hypothetical protein